LRLTKRLPLRILVLLFAKKIALQSVKKIFENWRERAIFLALPEHQPVNRRETENRAKESERYGAQIVASGMAASAGDSTYASVRRINPALAVQQNCAAFR